MWQAIASFILGNNRRGKEPQLQQMSQAGQDNLGHLGSSQFQLPTQPDQARNNNMLGSMLKNIFGGEKTDA